MPFKPFDYGNVLMQGEEIRNARMRNSLMQREAQEYDRISAENQRMNALRANRNATPEELIRGGLVAEGNALSNTAANSQSGKDNARGILANYFRSIAQAQDPLAAATQVTQGEDFRAAAQLLGFPMDRMAMAPGIDADTMRAAAQNFVTALGGDPMAQERRIQSTQVDDQGNTWAVFTDGSKENLSIPQQQYANRLVDITLSDGRTVQAILDPSNGTMREVGTMGGIQPPVGADGAAPQVGITRTPEAEAAAVTSAEAQAQSAADRGAKGPALDSLAYVASQFSQALDDTLQGGPVGAAGLVGGVTDYSDARRFDNLREQLSTELRTVFRIPGEGTLSDREQAQYSLQLPDRRNTKDVNQRILNDIWARANIRVGGEALPSVVPSSGNPDSVNWNDL